MRYAIFSDIHSNLGAFEAVLDFYKKSHIDQYLFLGDIVGYGAQPAECIALLRDLGPCSVAGNHDWAAVDMLTTDYFNNAAQKAILWTREHISEADRRFLSDLPLTREEKEFCLVHGTLNHPQEFDYMADAGRAMATFDLLREEICFVGHSHWPGIFIEDEQKVYYKDAGSLVIEKDKRYIINDGSVGQPRDGDKRACCCIYDSEVSLVEFHRIEYDISRTQEKIEVAGLPASLSNRLALGR